MAYIIQRNNRFYVVAYDGLDPLTGKERRRWHPAGSDRHEAEQMAARLEADAAGSAPLRGGPVHLGEFLTDTWLPTKRRYVRATTSYRYSWMVDNYVNPAIGHVPLRRLRADHLDGLYDQLATTGGRHGTGLAPKTVHEVHVIIRSSLDLAMRRCSASEIAAEGPTRNEPSLVVSSLTRGASDDDQQRASEADEVVAGEEVGDLLGGHRRGHHPSRRGTQARGGCVDGDRHPTHGEGRCARRAGPQAGSSRERTELGARSSPRRDRPADRSNQVPGDRAGGRPGKIGLGLNGPVPARVPAEVKELVLKTVDDAVAAGFSHRWACSLWQVSDDRVHRWRARRRDVGTLEDLAPGGTAVHALLPAEVDAIMAIAEQWGPVDRSHRKLAHRGSYVGQVWVSPSTFRRVLAAQGLVLPQLPAMPRRDKTPWPDWLVWEPNRIWIWDVTHFSRSRRCVFAVIDMVSRYWIATLVSPEETSTQVRVVFDQALVDQGLDELLTDDRLDLDTDDPARPILLAVSDNGPAMTSVDTRAYMAMMAIAQHHGRPHTPTDQAWIETFFGHIKHEWPHLLDITDPALLETELDRIRIDYNTVRLHEAIGYVTPHDEHHGQGEAIREARRQGLTRARQTRLEHNRRTTTNKPEETP